MRTWIQLGLLAALLAPAQLRAEEEEQAEQRFVVTPPIYKKLNEAHELIAKGKLDSAMDTLETLSRKRLNDHEKSLVLQAKSHIFAAREKYAEAAKVLEECLALNALPAATLHQSRYNLGQLFLATKKPEKAVQVLQAWIKDVKNPHPSALYTMAVAYTQAKQPNVAVGYAQRAVDGGPNPQDAWLQLALSLRFELKQYSQIPRLLKALLNRHPKKKQYWLQLASAYEELGDSKRALAVMELAYGGGVLERPEEITNLVQRLIANKAPAKGARILKAEMASKRVPENSDTLKLLANAWLHARERKEALESLTRLAKSDSTGKTYLRIAQVNVEMERWEDAARAVRSAVAKGGLDSPGQAHLLLGTVLANQEQFDAARRAFSEASKFRETERSAKQWLGYLDKQKTP
jgi:predicted Zn-dependent protease